MLPAWYSTHDHGMQVDGQNYLIPTEANPQIKADLDDQCLSRKKKKTKKKYGLRHESYRRGRQWVEYFCSRCLQE